MNGFVAIVDILGASGIKPESLSASLDELHLRAKTHSSKLHKINQTWLDEFVISAFGDTLIFSWPDFSFTHDQFLWFLHYVAILVKESVYMEIPLRGAISYGNLHRPKPSRILGHALNDAAFWHDKAAWIGVIITTQCCKLLETFWTHQEYDVFNEEKLKLYIASRLIAPRYKVPMKDWEDLPTVLETKVINWLHFEILDKAQRKESLKEFKRMHKENITQVRKLRSNAPETAKTKYDNAIAYMNWVHGHSMKVAKGRESYTVFE